MECYRDRIFPWLLDHLVAGEQLEAIRDRVAGQAVGHVLEVGSGTGANFLCYSNAVFSLTTVDPNPGMNKRARRRIKYLDFSVDARELRCEALPMKDATFDCVVSTLTLCSLTDTEKSLSEIYRVLKPGGRFLFLEHGLSDCAEVANWQTRLTPLQKRLFDGCHLNREIDKLVRRAGFELGSLNNYFLEKMPRAYACMYEGVATK